MALFTQQEIDQMQLSEAYGVSTGILGDIGVNNRKNRVPEYDSLPVYTPRADPNSVAFDSTSQPSPKSASKPVSSDNEDWSWLFALLGFVAGIYLLSQQTEITGWGLFAGGGIAGFLAGRLYKLIIAGAIVTISAVVFGHFQ